MAGRWQREIPVGHGRPRADLLSAIMYGARISLAVGCAAVLLSMVVGVSAGLLAGYVGGRVDAVLMRLCDVVLSFHRSWLPC